MDSQKICDGLIIEMTDIKNDLENNSVSPIYAFRKLKHIGKILKALDVLQERRFERYGPEQYR